MSINNNSHLTPSFLFRNKHFNTLYRYLKNKENVVFTRERMHTNDGDFIDLDISTVNSKKVILSIHGLEGSSKSSYIQSLTQEANKQNYDVIAMNLRGCSGEPNLLLPSYHSGKTSDLLEVIQHVENKKQYEELHLVGFSLGGNLTLKLLGENPKVLPSILKSAVAISVPCDLKGSADVLNIGFNKLYQYEILKSLKAKALEKLKQFPNSDIDKNKIINAKNFTTYDEYLTAKINGFDSANDYYTKSSSKQFIKGIRTPSLIINALDDSFLSDSCYPYKEVTENKNTQLLTPKYGGHVGFYTGFKTEKNLWLERKILSFFKQ